MTINFELRNRPDKKGYCLLRVIIQDRGKRVYLPLDLKLLPVHWDARLQKVKTTHAKSKVINNVLALKMADLQAQVATESLNGKLSLEKIAGRKINETSFRSFAGGCLHKWDKSKSVNTIRAYTSMLKQAVRYDRDVTIEQITPDWLALFEHFNRSECGDGGTLKRISFISVILKQALRAGIIDRDPFLIYKKPAKKNPPKVWLTLKELSSIERLAWRTDVEIIKRTCYWFLLGCYTGLRYSDIEKFNPKMIQDGRLILYTQKTGEIVSMKLTPKIKELVKKVSKLGPVYRNQDVNAYLKTVAHLAKIDKLVTFHTARHSFAVNCANLGISIEVTAKLLGHQDLKATSIYYKIINKRVDEEMKRWEN